MKKCKDFVKFCRDQGLEQGFGSHYMNSLRQFTDKTDEDIKYVCFIGALFYSHYKKFLSDQEFESIYGQIRDFELYNNVEVFHLNDEVELPLEDIAEQVDTWART